MREEDDGEEADDSVADLDERREDCWEIREGGLGEVIGRARRLGPVGHHEAWAIELSTPLPMQAGVSEPGNGAGAASG